MPHLKLKAIISKVFFISAINFILAKSKKSNYGLLLDEIFENYNVHEPPSYQQYDTSDSNYWKTCFLDAKQTKPCFNHNSTAHHVQIDLTLKEIIEVNVETQTINCDVWVELKYADPRLAWEITPGNGYPTEIKTDVANIWLPDIVLHNSANNGIGLYNALDQGRSDALATVSSQGIVDWYLPVKLLATCALRAKYFPFDVQMCDLQMGSWSREKDILELSMPEKSWSYTQYNSTNYPSHHKNQDFIQVAGIKDLRSVHSSSVVGWEIVTSLAILREQYGYHIIRYYFLFERDANKYAYSIIFPCIVFGLLSVICFFIPPGSGERLGLSAALLISVAVYQTYINDVMPQTQEKMPIMTIFLILLLINTMVSTCFTVLLLRIFWNKKLSRPNKVLQFLFVNQIMEWLMFDEPDLVDRIHRCRNKLRKNLDKCKEEEINKKLANQRKKYSIEASKSANPRLSTQLPASKQPKRQRVISLTKILRNQRLREEQDPETNLGQIFEDESTVSQDKTETAHDHTKSSDPESSESNCQDISGCEESSSSSSSEKIESIVKFHQILTRPDNKNFILSTQGTDFKSNEYKLKQKKFSEAQKLKKQAKEIMLLDPAAAVNDTQLKLIKKLTELEWSFVAYVVDRLGAISLFLLLVGSALVMFVHDSREDQVLNYLGHTDLILRESP